MKRSKSSEMFGDNSEYVVSPALPEARRDISMQESDTAPILVSFILASFELDVFPLAVLDLQNQIWSIKSYQEIPYDESPSGGTIDRTRARSHACLLV
jgi:hypothetical protein